MDRSLYPIKFKPILHEKIWGGQNLSKNYGKPGTEGAKTGESWEISGLAPNISEAGNGFLAGNSLTELIEIYMGDLVGDAVYDKFGTDFPLLFKLIDASDTLSIQVHPGDDVAAERHGSFGKTEMWYILEAEKGSCLINGFKNHESRESYLKALETGEIESILNSDMVAQGDVFFIPNGRVHGIGAGILLAEIQQSSDITYRIYDYNRLDNKGNPRELHQSEAVDVIVYSAAGNTRTNYNPVLNKTINLVECEYFKTNLLELNQLVQKDYNLIDSFVVYMCIDGHVAIKFQSGEPVEIAKGETVLIPAVLKNIELVPRVKSKLLEVYIIDNEHNENLQG
jgi:mannose-6-phosphate isomerase